MEKWPTSIPNILFRKIIRDNMRIFISINIPENIKKEIIKIQNSLPEFIGKKTEYENFHLTLKFLGEIDKNILNEMKKRLNKIKFDKFETEMDKTGIFDNRKSGRYNKPIIIWLHMTNCEKLQKEIEKALKGLFEKEKRFMSHLTIARAKDIDNKEKFLNELSKIRIKNTKFIVDKFFLMQSKLGGRKGPVYTVLQEFSSI